MTIISVWCTWLTCLSLSFSTRRFPGYSREGKKFNADVHRQHIFGLHVSKYMTSLKEENADLYAKQFSRFVRAGIEPSSVSTATFFLSVDLNEHLCAVRSFIQSCSCCHSCRSISESPDETECRCTETETVGTMSRVDLLHRSLLFLAGTKLSSLDHRERTVFNNVKQLISQKCAVAMLNKRWQGRPDHRDEHPYWWPFCFLSASRMIHRSFLFMFYCHQWQTKEKKRRKRKEHIEHTRLTFTFLSDLNDSVHRLELIDARARGMVTSSCWRTR